MAFGQQSGPPATARQVAELLDLLHEAGHTDFRDARGPMGFTQRQAGGKFTRDEADGFIERLQAETDPGPDGGPAAARSPSSSAPTARTGRPSRVERLLAPVSDQDLAAELQRRGWVVMEP